MMKTILLLAVAVVVSGAPAKEEKTSVKEEKTLLGELLRNLGAAIKNLPVEHKGKEIFLEDLKMDVTCSEDVFCKAERELKKVSGLNKYDDFRTDKTLMRDLHMYNNGTTCDDKPADKDSVQVILHDFLKSLRKCAQSAYSKK
ncbi:interleukin-13 [Rhinichthys klamathensis goyatoka]|uniref:interleukin-13 n=1 Tax=Rhinichthys klamathensis goyatoka TaxID=3034132 RepID=UPI0024B56AE6|nr:interleukin-13 [Rhinichthys klamathensis goyatoka]